MGLTILHSFRADEALVPEPIVLMSLKRYKSPGIEQILAELAQAERKTLRSEIIRHN
jgi:hypothetical protein